MWSVKDEMWGTYSVRDHMFERPFVADVVLYDKLVVPVPPPRESSEHESEWRRWEREGWDPALQERLLAILGERVVAVPWDAELRANWSGDLTKQREAQPLANAFFGTGSTLLARLHRIGQLPTHAGAINAVATYRRLADLEQAIGLKKLTGTTKLPAGESVAILGRELLVPNSQYYKSDTDLLKAALELSSETKNRRQAYWDWQQRIFSEEKVSTASIQKSVKDMADLLADERRAVRWGKARLTTIFVLTVGCVFWVGINIS